LKQPKKKKLPAGITDEFIAEAERASVDELKSMIVRFEGHADETRTFLKTNENLVELKRSYDEAVGPSRDTLKVLKNRTKYVVDALKKQGAI
jgi:hypothetical protein